MENTPNYRSFYYRDSPTHCLLATVGYIFRLLGSSKRPDFMLLQANNPSFKKDFKGSFTCCTFNTALMPTYACNLNHMRSPYERAEQIGDFFLGLKEEAPDVLCMQECFDLGATSILCERLQKMYPQIVYSVLPNEKGLGSGLLIASKFRIEEIEVAKFTRAGGADAWANKGYMGIKVALNSNCSTWIYNTHLQAKSGQKNDLIRMDQVNELNSQLREKDGMPIIVLGDFNISSPVGLFSPGFTHLERDQTGLDSSWYNKKNPSWGKTLWARNRKVVKGHIIDHVYVGTKYLRGQIKISDIERNTKFPSGMSDHLPVFASIAMETPCFF